MSRENQPQASLTLDPFRNRIRIHKKTIRRLGSPAYVQFLVNPEELYIAVLGSDKPMIGERQIRFDCPVSAFTPTNP